jgi:hypothetical protein
MTKRPLPFPLLTVLVLHGRKGRVGWFQLAVCCLGIMVYNGYKRIDPWFYAYWGQLDRAEATVVDRSETDHVYHPPNRPAHTWGEFWKVRFEFETSDGERHQGSSLFFQGQEDSVPALGAALEVEYPPGKPRLARAEDMARDTSFGLGPWLNLAALVWASSSLLLVLGGLWDGLRQARLLARGRLVTARLLERYETTRKFRGERVWGLSLEYTDPNGVHREVEVETTAPEACEATPDAIPLLHDTSKPDRALLPSSLPGRPRIGADRRIALEGRVSWGKLLLWPALGSLGLGAFLLFWAVTLSIFLVF